MSASLPADDKPSPPPPGPEIFLAPKAAPGRPATSTNTPPPPNSSAESQSPRAESSTNPGQDSSTRPPRADDGPESTSDTSSDSPGSNKPADMLARDIARTAVNITTAAHNGMTDDVGRAAGMFLATEAELEDASKGSASLLMRRMPAGAGSPDIGDLIRIGAALMSYCVRQIRLMGMARAARRQMASANKAQNGGDSAA